MSAPQHITPAASVRHLSLDVTDEQEANLRKLAAYLMTLPADYPDFAMNKFTCDGRGCGFDYAHKASCGTAACAVGHGPDAGIEPLAETWMQYSFRAFVPGSSVGSTTLAWRWCFSEDWSGVDNTAHGAAYRILWMLEHGVPDDAFEQRRGYAPLCYAAQS